MSSFEAPKGTYDLLPPNSESFVAVREALAAPLKRAGYGYVETPAFEHTGLFSRGVGEPTDIVAKGVVQLKDLTSGDQGPVPLDVLVAAVKARVGS